MDRAPLYVDNIADLTGITDVGPVVESLLVLALMQAHALEDGITRRAWAQVLRLGRTVETPLILAGRWGAWEAVLGNELRAAHGLGDRTAEAWSLHQLGTRALCLGDTFTARVHLSEALRIRESLGDIDGAAVTRHNLEFLSGPQPPPGPPEQPSPDPQVVGTRQRGWERRRWSSWSWRWPWHRWATPPTVSSPSPR